MTKEIFERLEGETAKAYAAFCIYRDLPPQTRSIKRANNISRGRPTDSTEEASGLFTKWASEHQWRTRAEAYDAIQERERRKRLERTREVEDEEKLEEFRQQQEKLGSRCTSVAERLLGMVEARLSKMAEDGKELDDKALATVARAAAALATVGTNAQAEALGVRQLQAMLVDETEAA